MINGYIGKALRVDLTTRQITEQYFGEEVLRKYIGGSGLATKILYDETDRFTEPLSPENRLIFMTGPLVGTRAVNSGRHHVVARSPLTGIYGESSSGGTFGPNLKFSGYDGLIIYGKSDCPVYLWIDNGKAELRDAAFLWGKDTYEVGEILKAELGNDIVTASIGVAGERLSRIAAIMNDGIHGRAAGRCGMGAVMGSKLLKAIAVHGTLSVPLFDEAGVRAVSKEYSASMVKKADWTKYGTSSGIVGSEAVGNLPIKNWSQGNFAGVATINGHYMAETILTNRYYCEKCILGCGRTVEVKEGRFKTIKGSGPEYETIGLIGSNCLIDDLKPIALANELCNRYGIDTISTGAAIAFGMEAFERGLITRDQTGGVELRFGDPDALIAMVHKIGKREDIGYLLGEGAANAAKNIGGVAEEFTVH